MTCTPLSLFIADQKEFGVYMTAGVSYQVGLIFLKLYFFII